MWKFPVLVIPEQRRHRQSRADLRSAWLSVALLQVSGDCASLLSFECVFNVA
jgi:hypothetical protein